MTEIYGNEICVQSFREMQRFVLHANKLGERPMLFGGWAVNRYNPYAGSRDVDFVVSDEAFDALIDFLVKNGYGNEEGRLFKKGVFFDLYKQSEDIGSEGHKLAFKLLYENCDSVYLRGYSGLSASGEVFLPTKTRLLYFKINALAYRNVPKDRSDVIALLLKASEEEQSDLAKLLSPELKKRMLTLRNDQQALALVTEPTQKNVNKLNKGIKIILSKKTG